MPVSPSPLARHCADRLGAAASKGLIVALSGGADSVALLLLLQECGISLRALHANFHLRGEESQRDEDFVCRLCRERGVDLEVRHFDAATEAAATGESLEMAARRLRYVWFAEQQQPVVVAHHADDNAETFFLNLLRGTGLRGLAGMKPINDRGILRPLLDIPRQRLLDYLRERGQTYVDDSTNADTAFRRNYIRHRILPLLRDFAPHADEAIRRTQQHLLQAEALVEIGLRALDTQLEWAADALCSLPRAAFGDENPAAQAWLHARFSAIGFVPQQLADLLHAQQGALFASPTHVATIHRDHILLSPLAQLYALPEGIAGAVLRPLPQLQATAIDTPPTLAQLRDASSAYVDAEAIVGALEVRPLRPADRFTPFGMRGSRLASDYLADRHLSRLHRLRTLVVVDARGIVWMAGHTIDQRVAITPETPKIVRLALLED